jgi:archaemetzincin
VDVTIQPFGDIPAEVLTEICRCLADAYGADAKAAPATRVPNSAWLPSREQYDATELVEFLEKRHADAPGKVLGVCDVDLCTPVLTFVFGVAQVGGRIAVISLHRLHQEVYGLPADPELLLQRCAKEAIHEIGHTCGLRHCIRYDCVMHSAESVEEADLKRMTFCQSCASKLANGTPG